MLTATQEVAINSDAPRGETRPRDDDGGNGGDRASKKQKEGM